MRAIIQRVSKARVEINNDQTRAIDKGFMILLGIEEADADEDIKWLAAKIATLRIFSDEEGKMNLAIDDIKGDILLVSQFTLYASTKKGNRPSFTKSARPETAIPLYKRFITTMQISFKGKLVTGEFGADMQVSLTNDGPVTIIIDSKNRE